MSPNTLSRRGLFKGGSVLAITAALPLPLVSRTAQAQTTRSTLLPDAIRSRPRAVPLNPLQTARHLGTPATCD